MTRKMEKELCLGTWTRKKDLGKGSRDRAVGIGPWNEAEGSSN